MKGPYRNFLLPSCHCWWSDDTMSSTPPMSKTASIVLENITCVFPGIRALDAVNLHFRPGEVHALAGENGAGKSTVLKVLAGLVQPAAGRILVDSSSFTRIEHPRRLGIRLIPQEPALVPDLSIAENIFVGRLPRNRFGCIDWDELRRKSQSLLDRIGLPLLDPEQLAGDLSTSHMQLVQVARALSDDGRVFLFDEATSCLTPAEVNLLGGIMRELREQEKTVIFVSHRIAEMMSFCDCVTVLRDGKVVGTSRIAETSPPDLVRMMVGREIEDRPAAAHAAGEPVLEVRDLRGPKLLAGISLTVRAGEIVGLAGLVGAGKTELLETIFGARLRTAGTVYLRGSPVGGTPAAAAEVGLALVPEDRKRDGLALQLSVAENLSMASLPTFSAAGFLRMDKQRRLTGTLIDRLRIKCGGSVSLACTLSGGNQQKIVLGKWLVRRPSVLLLDEPTRGVDVGAKAELHRILCDLASEGVAILMASSDMTELLALSDRVVVLCEGRIQGELRREEMSEESVLRLATPGYAAPQESVHG